LTDDKHDYLYCLISRQY